MKTAILLHEPEQLEMLDVLVREWFTEGEESRFLSLDAGIDYELEKRSAPFVSAKNYQNRTEPAAYLKADMLARELCEDPVFARMIYRGIPVLSPLRFTIQLYFIDLLYYVDLLSRFVDAHPDLVRLVVPSPTTLVPSTSAALAEHEAFLVKEAAQLVAKSRGISCSTTQGRSVPMRVAGKGRVALFFLQRALFGAGLFLFNALMALRPRRPIRLIVTDYWRNIAPVLAELPEAEVVLLDRTEAFKAGLGAVWRHKLRFMHIDHFLSRRDKLDALRAAHAYKEEWLRTHPWQSIDFEFCGVSLAPISTVIMTRLMERTVPQITSMIAGIDAMYKRLSPDAVLVRASVSRQPHFILLPKVAELRGIPALEIQHGGEYLGPGSATREHAARFIAAYGPLVCQEFEALGYPKERLLSAGSPRFDAYIRDIPQQRNVQGSGPLIVLSNTPTPSTGERYGTYSFEEYFAALGNALRGIENTRLEITSRLMPRGGFVSEVHQRGLAGIEYKSVGITPLATLFKRADIFVCSYSTVAYEALLYRLPVILVAFAPVEKMMADFHFSHFEKTGALVIAHTPEELRDILHKLAENPGLRTSMSTAGSEFMQKNFSFDGNASGRIANKIRNWKRS